MSPIGLVGHQLRYDLLTFVRNPAAVFFTAILPLIFLVTLTGIFGNQFNETLGVKMSTYYVPSILALSVVSATFINLAMSLTRLREDGVLKRLRGTPLPAWVFIVSRVLQSFVVTAMLVTVLSLVGRLLYGVRLPTTTVGALVVALLVGAASFSCLGIAVTRIVPNEDAAPAVTNAIVLPLYMISGTFFATDGAPSWMRTIARVFPLRPFTDALLRTFDPMTQDAGFDWSHLAVVAAWGVAGLLVALTTFRWTPRSS
jgi:ABC-2 type transport system permease protein